MVQRLSSTNTYQCGTGDRKPCHIILAKNIFKIVIIGRHIQLRCFTSNEYEEAIKMQEDQNKLETKF